MMLCYKDILLLFFLSISLQLGQISALGAGVNDSTKSLSLTNSSSLHNNDMKPGPNPKLEVLRMTFLVTVNLTWGSCIHTVKTPPLKPDQNWNETEPIVVGKCDKGPLTYNIVTQSNGETNVEVTFYTSAIGVQPPSCRIVWNYMYIEPATQSARDSPLPGCFINDSQEGWHVTYYWLRILDWELDSA